MANLKDIPNDILLEIVTRLPIESILDCKLVCKPWLNLVSHHPLFSKLHLAHLNRSTDSGKLSYLLEHHAKRLHYFEYNEDTRVHSITRIDMKLPFALPSYKTIGSINGLVGLYGYRDHTACICNPVTREYVMLPDIRRDCDDYCRHCSIGFGYLPLTNEYKVVELYCLKLKGDCDSIEVVVYTLGSGSGWRTVGRFAYDYLKTFQLYGVFLKGALYWMHLSYDKLFVFDLAEEKFHEHGLPPPLPVSTYCRSSIGVLGGHLYCEFEYFCRIAECKFNDIWLLKGKNDICDMKEQVEQDPLGWSKEFCIPGKTPLGLTKSGSVLCVDETSLSIYDPISSISNELVDILQFGHIIPHKNTLVSLKELGEEDIKIMESAKILEEREQSFPTNQLERRKLWNQQGMLLGVVEWVLHICSCFMSTEKWIPGGV